MLMANLPTTNSAKLVQRSAIAVAWVAVLFSFAIAVLLLVNHVGLPFEEIIFAK